MKIRCIVSLLFLFGLNGASAFAIEGDPCDDLKKKAIDIRLELRSTEIDRFGLVVGKFVFTNYGKNSSIGIEMFRDDDGERLYHPYTSIEYLDVFGVWRRLLSIPGSFRGPTSSIVLASGESKIVEAMLMSREAVYRNSRGFRLLVRAGKPRLCIFSVPFKNFPIQPPVVRLQSVGVP